MKSKNKYKVLWIFFFVFATLPIYSNCINIPFEINERNRIVVKYVLSNRNVRFVFDTGSTGNLVSSELAAKIGIEPKNGQIIQSSTLDDMPFDLLLSNGAFNDSIFFSIWSILPSKNSLEKFDLGDNVDGLLGLPLVEDKIITIDFCNSIIKFCDSIPPEEFENSDIRKIPLVRVDKGFEIKESKYAPIALAIQGEVIFADTIQIPVNFILDTGSPNYLTISVLDSTLFKTMVDYKKTISKQYGQDYPTSHIKIPQLGIDSFYVNLRVLKSLDMEINKFKRIFGSNIIKGNLGIGFFKKFDKIIFDRKKNQAYFIKKIIHD